MESVKRTIVVVGQPVLSKEVRQLLAEAGYKAMGDKFINYKTSVMEVYELSIILHDHDLHLDSVDKWNYGKLETSLQISQGYRCTECNGLDTKPNLSCVKSVL